MSSNLYWNCGACYDVFDFWFLSLIWISLFFALFRLKSVGSHPSRWEWKFPLSLGISLGKSTDFLSPKSETFMRTSWAWEIKIVWGFRWRLPKFLVTKGKEGVLKGKMSSKLASCYLQITIAVIKCFKF